MATPALAPDPVRTAAPEEPPAPRTRLDSVDLLRGLVMVIMAIDHTRDFFSSARFDPTDLGQTTAALFLTRWITHFCAPTFVFLAGTGAFLQAARGRSKGELSRFLLTRGLWLILVEVTIVRFGWTFDLSYHSTVLQVIWAIGVSMVVLSALVYLPTRLVALFGVLMIATHNLLDGLKAESVGLPGWLWDILHTGGPISDTTTYSFVQQILHPDQPAPGHTVMAIYPLVPWIGVMAAGYAFGALLLLERERRRRLLVALGAGLTLAFVLLRATNLYGDPKPWEAQPSALFTLFSFLNCQKYPPSLLFLLMTLGPAIMALALFDRPTGPLARPFVTFGRVPLFYYVLHLPLIHAMSAVAAFATYGPAAAKFSQNNLPPDYGYGLPVVYLAWLAAVLLLYLPCRWFADVKRRRRDAWLSYL